LRGADKSQLARRRALEEPRCREILDIRHGDILDVVPRDVAAAARTLLDEPVELARDAGKVWYVNGQHRTEAMLRQGVEEAVMLDTRLIDEPPLPGEIGRICVWVSTTCRLSREGPGKPPRNQV
jgi:hypothetical protein